MGKASRLRKETQNLELTNREAGKGYSSMGKDKDNKISMSKKGDRISNLEEPNQVLVTKTESLKEERGFRKQMKDNGKEPEKDSRREIDGLQEQLNNKEHSDSASQYKVTENSFCEKNEMLHKEVDSARCLVEIQNQRIADFLVENAELVKQLEEKEEQRTKLESLHGEFANKYRELEEKNLKLLKENGEQEKMILALQRENASLGNETSFFLHTLNEETKRCRELEEKNLKLLKENGEQEKMILALQRENASLGNETSFFLHTLNEETKRCREISAKCLENDERVLYLESQSLELQTELASAKSAYDEVVVQLSKTKEDMNKLSIDSGHLKEEKETLRQNMMLQPTINKELEEKNSELERSKRASEKEQVHLKERIGELETALDFVTKDVESCRAMSVEKECQLADSEYRLSELSQEETDSLKTKLNKHKPTMVSESLKTELNSPLESVKDLESNNIQLQQLMTERQNVHGNENSNSVQEDVITENRHVNPKPNTPHEIGKVNNKRGRAKQKRRK